MTPALGEERVEAVRAALAQQSIVLGDRVGAGASSTVYQALDQRHGRRVAVKILDPATPIEHPGERFDREIRLVAQFNHPHIVPLYDSGRAAGVRYYIMPFATGESLRHRLERGPLPPAEALRYAVEIADGLRYAHERKVVHRDIKPGNVLLESGHAFITDFGLAESRDRLVATEAGANGRMTASGRFVGTVEYMAPEQLVGEAVDERADLYALGCVIYEMLAGALPFDDSSPDRTARAKLLGEFRPLAERLPGLPAAVGEVVGRLLAPTPADRIQSAAEVYDRLAAAGAGIDAGPPGTGLRWAGWGRWIAALLVLAGGAAVSARLRDRLDPHRVVIAAFTNETGSPAYDPFGHQATDWINDALVRAGQVEVITSAVDLPVTKARDSTEVETTPERLAVLARETRSGTVIMGSYYKSGEMLQLQVEITDARTGALRAAVGPLAGPADHPAHLVDLVAGQVVLAVDSLASAGRIAGRGFRRG